MGFASEQHIHNETLREDVYLRRHDSGLPVYFCPKPGFQKRYACFATHFGSIDSSFRRAGRDRIDVPDGVAHFLEHQLFEGEDGNAFEEFSKTGAASNAYTSFSVTNYLFSCGTEFWKNLGLLISFVREPHFTDETVEKERGIIAQEIRMYNDDPSWRIYMNLLKGLYQQHTINIDIIGTVESISEIDKQTLYTCYETFYHPENMILFGIGDEQREEFFTRVDEALSDRKTQPLGDIERSYPEEPRAVARRATEARMVVSMPRVLIGFKDHDVGYTGRRLLERELVSDILLEIVFGRGSSFYQRLYEDKLIDDGFHSSYTAQIDVGYSMLGGETPDPDRLAREITAEIARLSEHGVSADDFERQKRATMGAFLRHFNSLEFIANNYCTYRFYDIDVFDSVDVLRGLEVEDLDRRLVEHLREESMAVSIVRPEETSAA